jgi:hypothetical protein
MLFDAAISMNGNSNSVEKRFLIDKCGTNVPISKFLQADTKKGFLEIDFCQYSNHRTRICSIS